MQRDVLPSQKFGDSREATPGGGIVCGGP